MKLISMTPKFESPKYIIWEITRQCNYDCPYCTFKNKYFGNIKYDGLLKILDNLKNSKHNFDLDFIGGEPTLYPQYIDLLEQCAIQLPNSNIYTTTNTSRPLSFFKELDNRLSSFDKSKIRFYFSYHIKYINLSDYIEKVNFLGSKGYPIYIKLVCDNNRLEETQHIHDQLLKTEYSKIFLKYLWNYREDSIYNKEYMNWINDNTVDNGYLYDVVYEVDGVIKTEIFDYKKIKQYNFDILTGYNCHINRLLYINIFGQVQPSCTQEFTSKSLLNVYYQNIDLALDESSKLAPCMKRECTELFNNPFKGE